MAEQEPAERLLQHRRRCADDADAGRNVQHQHQPDKPELRRLVRVAEVDVAVGDHRAGAPADDEAVGRPMRRRHAVPQRAAHHEDEVNGGKNEERLPHADIGRRLEMVHQEAGQRGADHRPAAEAHDRHAGRHAAPVGKPFDQRRNRRNVAEAQAHAADDARAQPHQPELMDIDAEGGDHEPPRPAEGRHHPRLARPCVFKPAAPDRRGRAQNEEEKGEHPAEVELRPVAIGGEQRVPGDRQLAGEARCVARAGDRLGDAVRNRDGAPERHPEHAEAIGHAYAKMNCQRGGRNKPAIESRLGDRPLAIEKSLARGATGRAHARHFHPHLGRASRQIRCDPA